MTVTLIFFALASSFFALAADDVVVDMPGLFKMQRIESLEEKGFRYQIQKYWRTDDELILSASKYKEWEASGSSGQRVFSWNIESGAITETPYVGTVTCATKDRLVVSRDVEVPDTSDSAKGKNQNKKTRMVLSSAVFGEPAVPIESNAYNAYACEPMERRIAGDYGHHTSLLALFPKHGNILTRSEPLKQTVWFLPVGGGRIQIGAGTADGTGEETYYYPLGHSHPAYLPWREQYVLLGQLGDFHSHRQSWYYDLTLYLVSPTGHIERVPEPKWIANIRKTNKLSVSFALTKAGTVWRLAGPLRGKPTSFDGLYVERNGQLIRFLRHADLSQPSVSPEGCRALVTIDPTHRNFPNDGSTELHLIDFCQEDSI